MSSNAIKSNFVKWNNRGADLMQRRKHTEAAECFSKAALMIQNLIKVSSRATENSFSPPQPPTIGDYVLVVATTSPSEVHVDSEVGISSADFIGANATNSAMKTELRREDVPSHACQCNGGRGSLYRDPVRISPAIICDFESAPPASLLRPLLVTAIINMAIARQNQALDESEFTPSQSSSCSKSSSRAMKQAIFLYETALKGRSQHLCMQPLGKDGFQLLLACYNNLGHAHRFMSCASRADVCFRSLLSLLMWAVVHGVGSAPPLESYWRSVDDLLLSPPMTATAA